MSQALAGSANIKGRLGSTFATHAKRREWDSICVAPKSQQLSHR